MQDEPIATNVSKTGPKVNGHGDELLYERGLIATNLPLPALKEQCHVNARARVADKATDFPRLIRQGIPGITP